MRILSICQRVPFHLIAVIRLPPCNETRRLGRTHELHVFCLADAANGAGLRDSIASITPVPVSPAQGWLRALFAVLETEPVTVVDFARSAGSLRALLRGMVYNLAQRGTASQDAPLATVERVCALLPRWWICRPTTWFPGFDCLSDLSKWYLSGIWFLLYSGTDR